MEAASYLFSCVFWIGLGAAFPAEESLTGMAMWIHWMAIYSYFKWEMTYWQALCSGTERYFAYTLTALLAGVAVGYPIMHFGGKEASGLAFVFGAIAYISAIALVWWYRHRDEEKVGLDA